MPRISSETHISPNFKAGEWESLRTKLSLTVDGAWTEDWDKCLKILSERVDYRFFSPVRLILDKDKKQGEGFTITAVLCILLEFFSALHAGKIYTTRVLKEGEKLLPFQYNSSAGLIKEFLTKQPPFKDYFNNATADKFYSDVRCGILHEARTKSNWKIKLQNGDKLIEKIGSDIILYRTGFFNALTAWFELYKLEVKTNTNLRSNLLRKMDDILDNKRCLYFAYGSNMDVKQLKDRIGFLHYNYRAVLSDYRFAFNKPSIDGSGKANIVKQDGSIVYGIVYEIDKDALPVLKKYEIGYAMVDLDVKLLESGEMVKCAVFVCNNYVNQIEPTAQYFDKIIGALKKFDFPQEYISETGNLKYKT